MRIFHINVKSRLKTFIRLILVKQRRPVRLIFVQQKYVRESKKKKKLITTATHIIV